MSNRAVISIQKYDFIKNSWNAFKSIPLSAAKTQFGSVFHKGEFFIIGGYANDGYNDSLNTVSAQNY